MSNDDWQVVPKEPTREMSESGRAALREGGLLPAYTDKGHDGQRPILDVLIAEKLWPAMLAAAPASPSPADTGGKEAAVRGDSIQATINARNEERAAILEMLTSWRDKMRTTMKVGYLNSIIAAIERGDHLATAGKEEG